ncbi:MAG TPA: HAD-IA family hydrolase [Kofleriaceae bacterium]|nr:HAD-IA family hydrolase [Kofleriaceae bacterium]
MTYDPAPAPDPARPIRAVLFDFGGVILSSPIDAFRAYERQAGLPAGFLQKLNMIDPDRNAWACMERGELDEDTFHTRFEAEGRAQGYAFDSRAVLALLTGQLRSEMVAVVRSLRAHYRVACLTNNMRLPTSPGTANHPGRAAEIAEVMALFEHVVESCKIGARKPEPRFYLRACELVGVAPQHCVFLDDLGINLKPARALGMTTIKVDEPAQAIADLEAVLGHPVR